MASGPGFTAAAFWHVFEKIMLNPDRWTSVEDTGSGHLAPNFQHDDSEPDRRAELSAIGHLFALLLKRYAVGLLPFCPFALCALLSERDHFILSPPLIAAFNPTAARILEPWLALSHSSPISARASDIHDPVRKLILKYFNHDVSYFHAPSPHLMLMRFKPGSDRYQNRTEAAHARMTSALLANVLLGHPVSCSLWDSPGFQALRCGMDAGLSFVGDETFIQVRSSFLLSTHRR